MHTAQDPRTASAAWARSRVHRRRWFTVLLAMATATALGAVAGPILGIDLALRPGTGLVQEVGILPINLTSLAAGLLGWALLVLLERWTARARRIWTAAAAVVLVLSLGGPPAAATPEATAVLATLHLVVAAILVLGFRGTIAGPRRPALASPQK
ncbi:DUF6069 family protein [Georgenia subflava]|uniref:Uncharacterized protein n=1 Tax=Georgenia subflava TaxID=1622177 RepID=A0A6N7EIF7_9MICO|nr:DUF6069 family protein [Georgenia subflava]MPV37211.1 hypothetical protein [Georgenia subflava]